MCKRCQNTDVIISEDRVSLGQPLRLDVRFDTEFGQIDVEYGVKGEGAYPDAGIDWSHSVQLNVCPFCGSTLDRISGEFKDELMAVGYDEEMKQYGIVCGVASNREMVNEMMERWHKSWKYVGLINLNPDFNIGDKYQFEQTEEEQL